MKDSDLLKTVVLNSAHIDIFENSIIFYDNQKEEMWEYTYPELFRLAYKNNNHGELTMRK